MRQNNFYFVAFFYLYIHNMTTTSYDIQNLSQYPTFSILTSRTLLNEMKPGRFFIHKLPTDNMSQMLSVTTKTVDNYFKHEIIQMLPDQFLWRQKTYATLGNILDSIPECLFAFEIQTEVFANVESKRLLKELIDSNALLLSSQTKSQIHNYFSKHFCTGAFLISPTTNPSKFELFHVRITNKGPTLQKSSLEIAFNGSQGHFILNDTTYFSWQAIKIAKQLTKSLKQIAQEEASLYSFTGLPSTNIFNNINIIRQVRSPSPTLTTHPATMQKIVKFYALYDFKSWM
jgi:hypothetical protein